MLHDALRLIRVYHDYSIDKTSLLTGIDPGDIAKIECGKFDISDVIIHKYACGFKMSESDINIFSESQRIGESKALHFARGQFTTNVLRLLNWIYTKN